jgi:hypothetical protein
MFDITNENVPAASAQHPDGMVESHRRDGGVDRQQIEMAVITARCTATWPGLALPGDVYKDDDLPRQTVQPRARDHPALDYHRRRRRS